MSSTHSDLKSPASLAVSGGSGDALRPVDLAATASGSAESPTPAIPSQQSAETDEEEGDEERMDLSVLQSFAE
jgi:hypothetical protein